MRGKRTLAPEPTKAIVPKVGRPTMYDPKETPKKVQAYVDKCIVEGKTPFIEEVALLFGVSEQTITRWAYPIDGSVSSFAETYQILLTVQKLDLKKKSLSGVYVSAIGRLLLSADHGVVERVRKEVTGEDGDPIKVESSLPPEQFKEYSGTITKMFEKIYSKA